jgi:hypothetical protein
MSNLKVAICFSGQPRAWKIALPSIKKFISEFDTPPDIFMHAWNFNTTSNHVVTTSKGEIYEHTLIEEEETAELFESYNPISFVLEDREMSESMSTRVLRQIVNHRKKDVESFGTPDWLAPQYYGIKKAGELKSAYEIENGFIYDIVIRMRYDSFFTLNDILLFHYELKKPKQFSIHSTHTNLIENLPFVTVGDILFYSDSITYDIISQYVDYLPYVYDQRHNPKNSPPHLLFSLYLQTMFLTIHSIQSDSKVARSDSYFNNLKSYEKNPYGCDIGSKNILSL